ncbi:hypothetical protein Ahy_A09g045118 [Arachis hypogaea]|uniref:2-oxo-4-hydroxy-4-carboxy-5-ureidoimidazoline decarboxylase n=1 Tax=Arachis hypogaea TaxID=3818 RepID=A0A445BLL5_ARAHY|nr:hypothetical protein Ahy_A09g045118 [Arachis hypogaea]
MDMASPFSSLEHIISIARDIWFCKVNVRCWLEAISGRFYFNQYFEMVNEYTMQELMYEEKFWYVFVTCASRKNFENILVELKTRFTNKHAVELDIASKEEMKHIEFLLSKKSTQTTNKGDMSAEYSGEVVNDSLDGAKTDAEDNLVGFSSVRIDLPRQFDLNKVRKENNETLYNQQRQDDIHVAKRDFNLNKKSWFEDDLSDPVSCECSKFLTEYFLLGQYDVEKKF